MGKGPALIDLKAVVRNDGDLRVTLAGELDSMRVLGADEAARFASLLRPWVRQPMTGAVRVRPDLVTGFRLEVERKLP
ncbi:hypothetical protein [Streptomyces sp. NPDC059761]|uniref:hypothetical protein n=1 Tax=Streptomyces sp. NPDC059761 TaxID=3346937 RepID=UPI00365AFA38